MAFWATRSCSNLKVTFAKRNVRNRLLQYIVHRTAVIVIPVLTADNSGRTVFR